MTDYVYVVWAESRMIGSVFIEIHRTETSAINSAVFLTKVDDLEHWVTREPVK